MILQIQYYWYLVTTTTGVNVGSIYGPTLINLIKGKNFLTPTILGRRYRFPQSPLPWFIPLAIHTTLHLKE